MAEKSLFDLSRIDDGSLDPIERVVEQLCEQTTEINPDQVMLVGAWCRDVLHTALGHDFATSATRDVDLALALSGWETYQTLSNAFPRAGDSGLAFKIAGLNVDLIPFGELEEPKGTIIPPTRREAISVWAFAEIFSSSFPLVLSQALTIRCPTVPGYTAAKLAAWLDRSEWRMTKDADDLALTAYWYAESDHIANRLYDTPDGIEVLVAEEADVSRAAARLLGSDVSDLVGTDRLNELLARWPGDLEMLVNNFVVRTGLRSGPPPRRREIIGALTRGLTITL